ncbi:MAG: hypothetical protein MUC62_05675 [Candidatus Thermoplasmatota archaeon]|nr:hypothetical protein [Candidatus Thermoplasmatota archaeon]
MRTPPIFLAMVIILSVLVNCSIVTREVNGVGRPAVTIELASYNQSVDVEPDEGNDGIVQFSGTISVEVPWSPSIQYLIVYLNATAGNGTDQWPASTSPPLTFSKQVTTQNFQVVVRVPEETTQYPQGLLTVSGRWIYSPGTMGGSIEPVTAIIYVIGYYDHALAARESYVEGYRGDEVGYDLMISNLGNAYDTYELSVENMNQLNGKGVYVSVRDVRVPPLAEMTVQVNVTISSTATRGNFEIELRSKARDAAAAGDPDITRSITLNLRVLSGDKPSDEPEVEPEPIPDEPEVPDGDQGNEDKIVPEDSAVNEDAGDGSFPFVGFIVAAILVTIIVVIGILAYIFGKRED